MNLRISRIAVRTTAAERPDRVRFAHRDRAVTPEDLVLFRWRERLLEPRARALGTTFDGCRVRPGTWTAVRSWLDAGQLRVEQVGDVNVLKGLRERDRIAGSTFRTPEASKVIRQRTQAQSRWRGLCRPA